MPEPERRTTVLVARPRGFCAGVDRAVRAVEKALDRFGAPIYVKHEIVHNKHVVAALEKQGAVTVEDLGDVPEGATVVFSAHGSPPEHYAEAKRRHLRVIDATCPLVTKVHLEMRRFIAAGYAVIYVGHKGHIEGIGVIKEAGRMEVPIVETVADVVALEIGNPERLAYLTQTTLSLAETAETIAALKKKFPQITAPPLSDICFATTNRQTAVRELARRSGLILIFGSKNSSNSNRLREAAEAEGTKAYLVDDIAEVDESWFAEEKTVGISAGASAPERVVTEALDWFRDRGYAIEELDVIKETIRFADPVELRESGRA